MGRWLVLSYFLCLTLWCPPPCYDKTPHDGVMDLSEKEEWLDLWSHTFSFSWFNVFPPCYDKTLMTVYGFTRRGRVTCSTLLSLSHDGMSSMMWQSSKKPSPDADTIILFWYCEKWVPLGLTLPIVSWGSPKTNLGNLLLSHELWKWWHFPRIHNLSLI